MKVEVFKEYTPPHGDEVFEDLIRRSDAIRVIENMMAREDDWYIEAFKSALRSIPSVEPKKGEWKDMTQTYKDVPHYKCTVCGYDHYSAVRTNFCPNCGSDNREKKSDE